MSYCINCGFTDGPHDCAVIAKEIPNEPESDIKMQPIILTIPDEYHILQTAAFANECPYDGTVLTKTGTHHGCYDGEFGVADTFTCQKQCIIQYVDMWRNSQGVRGLAEPVS